MKDNKLYSPRKMVSAFLRWMRISPVWLFQCHPTLSVAYSVHCPQK